MKTRLFVVILVVCIILGLFRTQSSVEPGAGDVPSVARANPLDPILGITYVLQSSTGFTLVEDSSIELAFSKDSGAVVNPKPPEDVFGIWFNAGCNNFHGDFRITRNVLESTDAYMMTEMGCPRSRHEQENWLAEFLMSGPTLSVSGDHLTFTGATASLSFLNKKVAEPDRALVNTLWTAQWYIVRGSLSWALLESYPTLSFSDHGTLSISDGCNQIDGLFTANGSDLILTNMSNRPISSTELYCDESGMLMIAAHYGKVFTDGALTYSIDANVLRIERGDNGVVGYTD